MQIRLLDVDPGLRERLDDDEAAQLDAALVAEGIELETGEWAPDRSPHERGHLGYLIVEGLMLRELLVAGAMSIEVLNSGDLLRPWLEDSASFVEARWEVVEPVRLAVLSPDVASSLCGSPVLVEEIVDRGLRRSRSLAVHAAIENIRGLDRRLLVLFWHLAEHWGHLEHDGVLVPLDLTHESIARLVGARRPSVTTALNTLSREGKLVRERPRGWLIHGEPVGPRG